MGKYTQRYQENSKLTGEHEPYLWIANELAEANKLTRLALRHRTSNAKTHDEYISDDELDDKV